MKRRVFLATGTGLVPSSSLLDLSTASSKKQRGKLGLTIASYNIRWRTRDGWKDALNVLDHCEEIGAGCLQIGVRDWTTDFAGKVRDKRESLDIALEGQIRLPKKEEDLDRFEKNILAAREAGASVLRTVCLGSRRYETFKAIEDWNRFVIDSKEALERAEPIVAKHRIKLAVENHKDWRINEFIEILQHISSERVGVTLDFGNNFALLEHPHIVAEKLAPYVMSTHLKDMALAEHEDGFLLSEVPLGSGVLDLNYMMEQCEKANPEIWFNLEMITRDPLQVPVFEDLYWTTLPTLPARDLAKTLQLARKGDSATLPRTSAKTTAQNISFEEANVRQSFAFARQKLGCS